MKKLAVLALAITAAACGRGNSDNVLAPESNALSPAQVNAALGPETSGTADMNAAGNEANSTGNDTNMAYPPDEPGMSNNSAQ